MIEFKLPELGENIAQGDLVRLMISLGASVTEGQPVMELETDKAVVEVPSSVSGTVNEIRVKEGEKVKVGQVIFTVENGSGAKTKPAEAKPAEAKPAEAKSAEAKSAEAEARKAPATPAAPPPTEPAPAPPPPVAAPRAAPAASGPSEFKMPELGENISQGDLVRLMIAPGAKVSEGQPVMELETDKAVVEVPSSVAGVVKDVLVKEGEKVKVGQVIFTLEGGASASAPAMNHAPVEHSSGQQGARLAFQAAMRAEGKTEEQALPPDLPSGGRGNVPHAGATGQGGGRRTSRPGSRRASRAASGPRIGGGHSRGPGNGPGRAHQQR